MWQSIMEWLAALSPLFINAWIGYWVYVFVESHHYAQLAGILAFFVFSEIDHIKRKLELQSNRLYALNRLSERYNSLILRLSQHH